MFSLQDLKAKINITSDSVECPVKGCQTIVERQRKKFKTEQKFQCKTHQIFIGPSTFEYPDEFHNLLWKDKEDLDLLGRIKRVKRESRIARDNSEDAVTWNVYRFLEKKGLVKPLIKKTIGTDQDNPELIYWSYSQTEKCGWGELNQSRDEFGESQRRSTEPDIIITTGQSLFFIEAKLKSGNKTEPSHPEDHKKYETGGQNWHERVFNTNYETVAIQDRKYELMRMWLIGTWIAQKTDKDFWLVNLVRKECEKNIETEFKKHIIENSHRNFVRATWEDIYDFIAGTKKTEDRDAFLSYFRNKTLGYDPKGRIIKAFSIE